MITVVTIKKKRKKKEKEKNASVGQDSNPGHFRRVQRRYQKANI